ncbi:MAG: transglycosylase SLT domain-containing protein [Acidobacteria bacterium]|nr:transglycosylase SLT domain-containing protein [Acidobacteriota bacterium]
MRIGHRGRLVASVVLLRVVLSCPALAQQAAPPPADGAPAGGTIAEIGTPGALAPDAFPFPEELREQVQFWQKVYAAWSLRQVALHDDRHLGLVYRVVDLPGPAGDVYTDSQREFVRRQKDHLAAELRQLEHKRRAGHELTPAETELAERIAAAAGEDGWVGASSRVRSQRGLRERFRRGVEIANRYDAAFREVFRARGLPEDLALLPHVESSFQAAARSSAGAVGLWQFTRGAGKRFLVLGAAIDERLDPVASAAGAARYLERAYSLLGDWALALTSYNHGVEGMQKARAEFGTDFARIVREYEGPQFGFASRNFYAEFLAAREIARAPGLFFEGELQLEPPLDHDVVVLDRAASVARIASRYKVPAKKLAALNPAWSRKALRGAALVPAGTRVWLPAGTLAPAAQVAAPAPAAAPRVHVVRRGDTLSAIARAHGVRLEELLAVNGLTKRSVLRPGQRIKLPGA